MTVIHRVRTSMTGFLGSPGVITMYALDGPALAADLTTFWHEAKNFFPNTVTLTVENTGDEISDLTGDVVGAWSTGAQTPKVGVSASTYPAPAGACINWYTDVWLDSRRLKGKSYLVPMKAEMYATNGTFDSTNLASLQAEIGTFLTNTATNFVIWHRPTTVGGDDGASAAVTSAIVRDKVAVLRSRRD